MANFDSPLKVIQRVDWQHLVEAHHLVCQGYIIQGVQRYKHLLLNRFDRYFYERHWDYADDPQSPSLNWACVYLAEYYLKERVWADWLDLYHLILPDRHHFSPLCQSRLVNIHGWAQLTLAYTKPEELLKEQQQALEKWAISDEAAAHHHLLMGVIYRRLNQPTEAIQALKRAADYFLPHQEPYYAILARDYLAATYSFFQSVRPDYIHLAQTIYDEVEQIVTKYAESAQTEQQNYNQGWHWLEKPQRQIADIEQAIVFFERGQANMHRHNLVFEEHLNRYGKACAYVWLGKYDHAIDEANAALKVFWSNGSDLLPTVLSRSQLSVLWTAICLKVIATAYEGKGQLDTALDYALRSAEWHQQLNLPVERQNLYETLIRLYHRLQQPDKAQYWIEQMENLNRKTSANNG